MMQRAAHPIKVIVLTGPTGIGKTQISLRLAELLNGEIISADSVQVYRKADIISDKISSDIRAKIPHHLVDILDANEDFDVAKFVSMARSCINTINDKGKVPIVVGGTGFYLRSLTRGLPTTPAPDDTTSEKIQMILDQDGDWNISLDRLKAVDEKYALMLQKNDYYRLHRALCIHAMTGKAVSSFNMNGRDACELNSLYDFRCFFLSMDRVKLVKLVDARVEQMIDAGGIEEVISMEKDERFSENNMVFKAIGYRQTLQYLKDLRAMREEHDCSESLDKLFVNYISQFQKESRHYARRQWTWFRKDENFHWIDRTLPQQDIEKQIVKFYQMSKLEFDNAPHLDIVGNSPSDFLKSMRTYRSKLIIYGDKVTRLKKISAIRELI